MKILYKILIKWYFKFKKKFQENRINNTKYY